LLEKYETVYISGKELLHKFTLNISSMFWMSGAAQF